MGRQGAGVAAFRHAHHLLLEPGLAAQLLDQGDDRVAAKARARDVAGADAVGLELLVARVAAQLDQPLARHRTADRDRAAFHRRIDRLIHDVTALLLALGGVAFGYVAELMAHGGGELGLVVDQGEQPAGDEDVAAGQRMGIGDRLVEDEEAVCAVEATPGHQALADAVDHRFQRRRAIERADRLFDFARQWPALGGGRDGRGRLIGGRTAAGQGQQREESDKTAKKHCSSVTPDCSLCARAPHRQISSRLACGPALWHS
jgi:hypothetical protein